MAAKRSQINEEVLKEIKSYWTRNKRTDIIRRIRKGIFLEVGPFEKIIEPKVQRWAHRMVPNENTMNAHADRMDLKVSIRKYLRRQTVLSLGVEGYFPELFAVKENEKEVEDEKESNKGE